MNSDYGKKYYRNQKYGDPNFVITYKTDVSFKGCKDKEDMREKMRIYMQERRKDKTPKPRGRPSKYPEGVNAKIMDALRKKLYAHGVKTYAMFNIEEDEKKKMIEKDIEDYLEIYLNL